MSGIRHGFQVPNSLSHYWLPSRLILIGYWNWEKSWDSIVLAAMPTPAPLTDFFMGLRTKIYFFVVCLFKFSYFLNLKCCMMKGRKRDTQVPSVGSILTNPPKIKVRWSFPRGWQGCISKKLDENSSAAGTWTGTPIWEGDIPNSGITCCDTTPAPDQRYKLR